MAKETTAQRLSRLESILSTHGISMTEERAQTAEDRADYIRHGSSEHAAFLGLVKGDNGDITFTGSSGTYQLDDELAAARHYPGVDPDKAARAVLKQLVGELESTPTVPATAPPMWRPIDE